MQHTTVKLILAVGIITVAMGMLGYAGVQRGWVYALEVDAYVDQAHLHTQRVRLTGVVAEESVQIQPAQLIAHFDLIGTTAQLPVVYRGVIPPMFQPGIEAVVEGELDDHGVFQANILMTKCGSKYEAKDRDGDHSNPHFDMSTIPTEPLQ